MRVKMKYSFFLVYDFFLARGGKICRLGPVVRVNGFNGKVVDSSYSYDYALNHYGKNLDKCEGRYQVVKGL